MLGWGILGYGWVARDYMAPAVAAAGGRVVGVADPSPAARSAARDHGLAVHDDAASLLADPAVEAVYVATPNHLHRAAVEAAAAAGKAILCEKPMAASATDAAAMLAACRRAGVLYGTAFDQRWHPAHRAVREQVAAGAIGVPTAVRIVYGCWLGPDFSPCAGHDNWRIDGARAGGGAAIDLAPHGIDLIDFLLGEPLVDLHALLQRRAHDYSVDDGALLMGSTASGVLAQLHVAYNLPDALPRRRLEITGTAGQVVAENTMGQTPGGTVTLLDVEGTAHPIPFDPLESPFTAQARAFVETVRGAPCGFDGPRDLRHFALLDRALAQAAFKSAHLELAEPSGQDRAPGSRPARRQAQGERSMVAEAAGRAPCR